MNELRPLLDETNSERLRAVLEAGRADAPPSEFHGRLMLSLGLGAATIGGVSSAAAAGVRESALAPAAAAGKLAPSAGAVVGKWLVVGVCSGGLLAGGAELLTSPRESSAPLASVSSHMPSNAEPAAAKPSNAEPQAHPLPPLEAASAPPSTSGRRSLTTSSSGSVKSEVQAIDVARRALAAGDVPRALAELDAYDRASTPGVLAREARVLRIEALQRSGAVTRARALAEQYLRDYPRDAHAPRLRDLTGIEEAR